MAKYFKRRKENYPELYIVIHNSTNQTSIYSEITPLSEKIGLDRSTIYRKFTKFGDVWSKNGYTVYRTTDINLKSRRGK